MISDSARLAAKLQVTVSVGGGLDYRSISEVLQMAPSASRVSVGRAVLARSLLVGLDRAVRDFLVLVQ
jgi:pyridoxine 5-phosphate synthase